MVGELRVGPAYLRHQQRIEKFMREKYPTEAALRDGTKLTIRPMVEEDYEKSLRFFRELPHDARLYLKADVTDKDVVKRRMRPDDLVHFQRLVALDKDRIVADATLYQEIYNWKRHLGEIRVIVHPDYQRKGLGTTLVHELYEIGHLMGVDIIYANIVDKQTSAIRIFSRLGFKKEIVKKGHVKDLDGQTHDLVVMACNLAELWEQWEALMLELDTGRG